MTTDALVTSDLAALATDNRRGLPALELTPPRPRGELDSPPRRAGLDVLVPSWIFARRVATIAAALAVLASCAALLAMATGGPFEESVPWWLVLAGGGTIKKLVLVALAVRGLATAAATRTFERRVCAGGASMRLVASVDGWSVALGIAGLAATAVMVGSVTFVIGQDTWVAAGAVRGLNTHAAIVAMLWQAGLAIALALVAGIAIARACGRDRGWSRALESRGVAIGGAVLLLLTCVVTLRADRGDLETLYLGGLHASIALRLALTLSGTLAALLISAFLTLRRRRRELDQVRSIT